MSERKLILAVLLVGLAAPGCNSNPFELCPDCVDAAVDATPDASGDACVPDGDEACDGTDNDCDGDVDEGALPGVGEVCSQDLGECREGTTECVDGAIVCGGGGVSPSPEVCDGLDNDCNGVVDNGSPGGGVECGGELGTCKIGVTDCIGGALTCVGGVEPVSELCDGLDNDCDGSFDEDIPPGGTCGTTDVGLCSLGTFQCVGGVTQCVGVVNPTLEVCDNLDHDCDGNPLNGFNLQNDPQNCGTCGNVCSAPNAISQCGGGNCGIALCFTDFWDVNGSFADGCEYGPCQFQSDQEGCNQVDDDCDSVIDEDLVPPPICDQDGACAGTVATCATGGFVCNYGPNVQTDVSGNIVPETLCDNIDNDCDGKVDESHPGKGDFCGDGEIGVCQTTGQLVCNPANPTGALICDNANPGEPPVAEACNNLDDDCDGLIDEGALTGAIQQWVDIGDGVEMFAFEASHPDATATDFGSSTAYVCSTPGMLPWTNVTPGLAEAACNSIGARLCTEFEWQRACKGLEPAASPIQQGGSPNFIAFVEAEEFVTTTPRSGKRWVMDTSPGYSGIAAMRVVPNTGTTITNNVAITSPQLDYAINFTQTGTHFVWVLGWGPGNNDDTVHVGLDGALQATSDNMSGWNDEWTWRNTTSDGPVATINVANTGVHTLNVWMREDGFRIDAILVTRSSSFVPNVSTPNGCEWSYSTSCTTYSPTRCNGLDFDTDPGIPGNQDRAVPGGSRTTCFSNWGAAGQIFDLSGNIKEWTAPRDTGVNPIRGGAFTTTADGLQCDFLFTVADDSFFFPNVGFRCCR